MPPVFKRVAGAVLVAGLIGATATTARGRATDSAWLTRQWTKEEGLPDNRIHGLAQTPDGYIWVGTPVGLARFDGAHFRLFASSNYVNAPNRGVLALVANHAGGLCLAMDRGVVVSLSAQGAQLFLAGRELPTFLPDSLLEDPQNALWISYRNGNLVELKEGRVAAKFGPGSSRSSIRIFSLARDTRNRLWYARGGEIGTLENGELKPALSLPNVPSRIIAARAGGIWICSGSHLYQYDLGLPMRDCGVFESKAETAEPNALLEDRSGAVWIGTSYHGLFRFGSSGFEKVPTSHPGILSLLEDAEGNLWAGTDGGGLNQVHPRAVSLEGTESGLPFQVVQSLTEDTAGQIWATTQSGAVARRTDRGWVTVPMPERWSAQATCIVAATNGDLWIGTRDSGVLCCQSNRIFQPENFHTHGQRIHSLLMSRSGDLWIGEDSPPGVERFHGGKLETLDFSRQITVIRAAAEDVAGNIWFGTSRGILLRPQDRRLVDETALLGNSALSIRCLYATQDGSLWVGSPGWGVGRLKNHHFSMINTRQGLHDDYISQIVADDGGWLWFGSGGGIFKVRQSELDAVADGQASRVRSIYYGRGAGLAGLEANFGDSPGVLRSGDGRLWVPMRTGLAVIEPDKLGENLTPPTVIITRVGSGDKTLGWYGGAMPVSAIQGPGCLDLRNSQNVIKFPARDRRLDIEFTALTFAGPENTRFRYRLEGVDPDWTETDMQRTVSYLQLPAAAYRFRVTGCNSEGVWNEAGASLSFVILPFFWQTLPFRIAALALFTVAVIALVRYVSFRRLRRQLRHLEFQSSLHQERARIARDIHDDLGANLTQIALLGDLAQQDQVVPDKAAEHIGKISRTARQLIKSLDEIVWAVNPSNDTLAHLVDYTGQFALDYLRLAGISCRLDLPEQTPERTVSTDVRHNLFLIVKEALHNIVKHSHATEARLRVHVSPDSLRLSVEDNGIGFHRDHYESGADGLRNMRQRAAEIGAECCIESNTGKGTQVLVELLWTRQNRPTAAPPQRPAERAVGREQSAQSVGK